MVVPSAAGVGSEAMGLRASLQAGGYRLLPVLLAHSIVDEWPRAAMLVLLPDIQRTFDVSDTTVLGVAGLFGLVMVLAALPFGSLGDRFNRVRILAAGAILWGVGTIGLGAAPSMFVMALFVILSGVGQASRLPNSQSLLADGYPLQARNTVFAMESAGRPIGQFTGPFLCAGIVAVASGGEDWRWAFYLFAIPAFVLAVVTLIVPHPERGRYEQSEVLGDVLGATRRARPSRCRRRSSGSRRSGPSTT